MARDSFWDQQVDSATKFSRLVGITETTKTIADECLEVDSEKQYALITDTESSPLIVYSLAGSIRASGGDVVVLTMEQLPHPSAEPPEIVAETMKVSDVFVNMCTKTFTHTKARNEAQYEYDSTYFLLPAQTEDSLIRGAASADPYETRDRTERLQSILADGDRVHVTSETGTDIEFSIKDRPPKNVHAFVEGEQGVVRSWPSGETPTFPVHKGMNGTIVIDSFMMGVGLLDEPIMWEVEEGKIVDISGGPDARELENIINEIGDGNSYKIGEFSIGTNDEARIVGKPFEDKEVAGAVHFALGTGVYNPPYYEPDYRSSLHLDGIIKSPTIRLDGELIVDNGGIVV